MRSVLIRSDSWAHSLAGSSNTVPRSSSRHLVTASDASTAARRGRAHTGPAPPPRSEAGTGPVARFPVIDRVVLSRVGAVRARRGGSPALGDITAAGRGLEPGSIRRAGRRRADRLVM